MRYTRSLFMAAAGAGPMILALGAGAQSSDAAISDIITVYGASGALMRADAGASAYGAPRPYAETPRSVTTTSAALIDAYRIEDINDLIIANPGVFTGSFFGVPGSLAVRGARSDVYFNGFKRVENPGSFPTPLSVVDSIDVVRGPTPAAFGAGRVGGFLNLKPGFGDLDAETGVRALSVTVGSYDKRLAQAQLDQPLTLAGTPAGLHITAEIEDSESFYRGIAPQRAVALATLRAEMTPGTTLDFGAMAFSSEDYLQTPGWNRVTQDLIDTGTYITGRDTDLTDLDGNGRLTPDEVDAAVGSFFGTSNIRQFIDFGVFASDAFTLDTGVGAATLDRRTVFVSDRDIQDAETLTGFAAATHDFDHGGTLRAGAFYDQSTADLFVSYGFAAIYEAAVKEARIAYDAAPFDVGPARVSVTTGAQIRRTDTRSRQTFLSGYLVLDRRDLTLGPTPGDIFDDPFSVEPGDIGVGWDTDLDADSTNVGGYLLADVAALDDRLGFFTALRFDQYDLGGRNDGATVFDPALAGARFEADEDAFSYEIAPRFALTERLTLYATRAEGRALETNDGGGVEVDRIVQGNALADSELTEVGLKLTGTRVRGALALYDQTRTRVDPFGNLDEETGRGVELEADVRLTEAVTFTAAWTEQQTKISAPGDCGSGNGEFVVLPPNRIGVSPQEGYGGLFAALNASCLPELSAGYERRAVPERTVSGYATWAPGRFGEWGVSLSAGATYVSETGGKTSDAIVFPDYAVARVSARADRGPVSLQANINNVFDTDYFLPVQNVYEEVAALPGEGRTAALTATVRF